MEWGISLKFKLRGIKFHLWLDFFLFALGILIILGVLQFSFIKPYYRNNKIAEIKQVSTVLQEYVIETSTSQSMQKALQVIVNNNVCTMISNNKGTTIYNVDSLGTSCLLDQEVVINNEKYIPLNSGQRLKTMIDEHNGEFSIVLMNPKSNQEMILYGKKISSNLGNYYLFVNSPLAPVDSILMFFRRQYLTMTILISLLSVVISLLISTSLSKPIVKMKESADYLALGDYDNTHFEGSYFSEINNLAETLNATTKQLSKVTELRKDLIANISHDIKTPLTMIKAYAEMIMDISGEDAIKREEHLSVIIKEVNYLDHLVVDMQELSKLQAGVITLSESNFDLASKIRHIVDLFEGLLTKKKLTVICDFQQDFLIYADEIKMGQVISNFLTNAIKHAKEDGEITIKLERIKNIVRFSIIDDGVGISSENIPYIWDRYYKIDKSFSRPVEGSGLGLAIVKAILDSHRCNYGVISKEGEGSTFWFELKQDNVL